MGYSDLNHSDTKQGIGASVKRNEDARLVNGQGTYLADLEIPGTLEAAFIRSPVAHARLGAVAVMDVPVNNRDACRQPFGQRRLDRNGNVGQQTKAHRLIRQAMMTRGPT